MAEAAMLSRQALQQPRNSNPRAVPGAVFAQRKSTLPGSGPELVALPRDAGRPLEPSVKSDMERSFGEDFSAVRIHDDAAAHDSARAANARAFAAGNDIVFGEGAYRPTSTSGRALLAHELAHTVQQGGVQMKGLDAVPTGSNGELEREADRAAISATSGRKVNGLTKVGKPTVFKAEGDPPAAPPGGDNTATAGAADDSAGTPVDDGPSPYTVISEDPVGPGATTMVVQMGTLKMPRAKGKGDWVEQAHKTRASGGSLIFTPKFKGGNFGSAKSIGAFAEKPGEKYKNVWLNNYGFKTLTGMAKAFKTAATAENADPEVKSAYEDPGAKKIIDAYLLSNRLTAGKCDIDHIVEKQLGGTSTPGNLQLLVSDKNQESGRETYKYLKEETRRVLDPDRLSVVDFQMRFNDVQMVADESDGSYVIEKTLRSGKVKGSEEVQALTGGVAISLEAGGNREVVYARNGETTDIGMGDRRLIPGMKLKTYQRTQKSSASSGNDIVKAELASKPLLPGSKDITLAAKVNKAPVESDGSAGQSGQKKAQAAEFRKLTLNSSANKQLPFHYPYLSPGYLSKISVDDKGDLTGQGVIKPSIKFLSDLKVDFGPDRLALRQELDVAALNKSAFVRPVRSFFRFTECSLAFDLVNFKPSGVLGFTVGPAQKPLMKGSVTASVDGGNFVATGILTPAEKIPGIKAAEGNVTYHSQKGWSGLVKATSSLLPRSTTDAEIGFIEKNGKFHPYAKGGVTTKLIKDTELKLGMNWSGENISYSGSVTIQDPIPSIKQVHLAGWYSGTRLKLKGKAGFKWKGISAKMELTYYWKEGQEKGAFSGKADVALKQGKLDGSIALNFNEKGHFWGEGTASYQLTKHIKPTLTVSLENSGKIKLGGEVSLSNIALSKEWPKPGGEKKDLFTFKTPKFSAPTPVPGVTAYVQFYAGMGVKYGAGPITLAKAGFKGSLYPLEDDKQIQAEIYGEVRAPAFGSLYGKLGASIGAEVLWGAVGAKGSVEIIPSLTVRGKVVAQANATYSSNKFAFDFGAYAKGGFEASVGIDLIGTITAAYGWKEWDWRWNVGNWKAKLGPELKIDFGKMGYDSEKGVKWPSASNIKFSPTSFDPKAMMRNMLESSKAKRT